eukprot:1630571-Amphidinium_carterae.1
MHPKLQPQMQVCASPSAIISSEGCSEVVGGPACGHRAMHGNAELEVSRADGRIRGAAKNQSKQGYKD